jgi:ABC-type polysaccharide/polyol phosphate transport system ATPase subunit
MSSSSPAASPFAIEVIHLNKQFVVHHKGSLKNRLLSLFQSLRRWNRSRSEIPSEPEGTEVVPSRHIEQKLVLNDLNFQVPHGQSLAVIGSNGSGKSTLLGLLARVYKPTSGEIRWNKMQGEGRVRTAPLLELGAGFHHELTGWDNITFYGAMLGMTAR